VSVGRRYRGVIIGSVVGGVVFILLVVGCLCVSHFTRLSKVMLCSWSLAIGFAAFLVFKCE
jgi:hypothetical protein